MLTLAAAPLIGRRVRLDPALEGDRAVMRELLDRDPEHWAVAGSNGAGQGFEGWWSTMRTGAAEQGWITWLIRNSQGRAVGTSSYLHVKAADRSVEIGATFLHPDVRGGVVNPESKRLLLARAFDGGAHRVEFMVDARNRRSQAAVAKLGALREGVLRRNRITWTGHVRDTVVFSVTDLDWPAVKAQLDTRLSTPAPAA